MKTKEKMAEYYIDSIIKKIGYDPRYDPIEAIQNAYIAGFEAAKKLSVELILTEYSYEHDIDGIVITEGRDIHIKISQLGEEEIQ